MAKQQSQALPDVLRRLQLFNEKADKLLRCGFVRKVFTEEHSLTLHFGKDQPITLERIGPNDEATDALTLTLRFFFNSRDGISLDQFRALYQELPIPDEEKHDVRDAFLRYDEFLSAPFATFNGRSLTNWNIFETVLYGDLAHANDDKRPVFEEWQNAAPFDSLARSHYEDVVANIVSFIADCRQFNERIIRRLTSAE